MRAVRITWRRNSMLTGKPDFVSPKLRLAVFVDGCFWHGCPLHATQPRRNARFWREKIAHNQARDRLVNRTLRKAGWRILRIREHELARANLPRLFARLRRFGLAPLGRATQPCTSSTRRFASDHGRHASQKSRIKTPRSR